jgi:divalent metal cation (Fe/Co/Zn/Cd) transporter
VTTTDAAEPAGRRRALRLVWATVAWNVTEVVVSIAIGLAAGSLALVAFGFDSLFEMFASVVVIWHLKGRATRGRTRRAIRLVAVAFGLLAVALVAGAWRVLAVGHVADETWLGIAYIGLTAIVMLTLALLKRSAARAIGSEPLAAEATLSLLDGLKALGILAALALNALLAWWWADPVATLLIAAFAAHEAVDNWREASEG